MNTRIISIHALRAEGDAERLCVSRRTLEFLSTPSVRRATAERDAAVHDLEISIHALRAEGDG